MTASIFNWTTSIRKIHGDIGNGTSWLTTFQPTPTSPCIGLGTWNCTTRTRLHQLDTVIYANGVQIGSGLLNGTPLLFDTNHKLLFGGGWPGVLDDVRTYIIEALSRSRSAAALSTF